MAKKSFNLLSDAEVQPPPHFNLFSDTVIVPPNSFSILSDALVLPASAFALTSDAMVCLTPICERTPIEPPAEAPPVPPQAPIVNPPFHCEKQIKQCATIDSGSTIH